MNSSRMKRKILFGVPENERAGLFMDEISGLKQMGYDCCTTPYVETLNGGRYGIRSLMISFQNSWLMLKSTYRLRPDIIYIHSTIDLTGFTRVFITLLILRILYWKRVPVFIKSLGASFGELNQKSFFSQYILFPMLKRGVDGWLLLSKDEKRRMDELTSVFPDRTHVVKNIIRGSQFVPSADFRAKYGIPADSKILLYTGHMVSGQGVFKIAEAFATLKDRHRIFLIMVGGGRDFNELADYLNSNDLCGHVLLIGEIPETETTTFYANSDILVFPNTISETFSMSLFNGISAGLAIVSSPSSWAIDHLKSPENCVWVDPTSTGSVLSGIVRVCSDEALMRQMQWRNKKKSLEFCQQTVCAELNQIITSTLSNEEEVAGYTTLISKN